MTSENELENKSGFELYKIYEDYVSYYGLDPNAPKEVKKAYEIAMKKGQKKAELWKKGIRLY